MKKQHAPKVGFHILDEKERSSMYWQEHLEQGRENYLPSQSRLKISNLK